MGDKRVIVVGAGIGGLVTAVELARRGLDVVVVEKFDTPGGKMREVAVGPSHIDAGPTVFTMRSIFEDIFARAGSSLTDHVTVRPLDRLVRHAWDESGYLDLFADAERSADAIAAFAGPAEGRGFRNFCRDAERVYRSLDHAFIRQERPNLLDMTRRQGLSGLKDLWSINPFNTMWGALGTYFQDPRLRQLFGRYTTYCGSSPFMAPATLMLIAHVEQQGVWIVDGGMQRLAMALAALAQRQGVAFRYGETVEAIDVAGGRAAGVRLAGGERLAADAVVLNADSAALAAGYFGQEAAGATPATNRTDRSLSAVTWNLVAKTGGLPLLRHNVFFCRDYHREFDDIFGQRRLPAEPTVYICAQDRDDSHDDQPGGPERLLLIANAPACGDVRAFDQKELETCETGTFRLLRHCGLEVERDSELTVRTTPTDFERMFPATGGALYGRASHGWRASFSRPGTRSKLRRLYLTGGSVHPGAGIPMAAMSGVMAAESLLTDLVSTRRSTRTATSGGMSTG